MNKLQTVIKKTDCDLLVCHSFTKRIVDVTQENVLVSLQQNISCNAQFNSVQFSIQFYLYNAKTQQQSPQDT